MARLDEFHRDGQELAQLVGEFGALLLDCYLTVVPAGHVDCEAGYVMDKLVAVATRYLKRWCYSGGGAQCAYTSAGLLIECMQEVEQVHQFLADIRRAADGRDLSRTGRGSTRGRRSLLPDAACTACRGVSTPSPQGHPLPPDPMDRVGAIRPGWPPEWSFPPSGRVRFAP